VIFLYTCVYIYVHVYIVAKPFGGGGKLAFGGGGEGLLYETLVYGLEAVKLRI